MTVPRDAVATTDLGDRQVTSILDYGACQARRHLAFDRRVRLGVALSAAGALEPAAQPDQRHPLSPARDILDLHAPCFVDLGRLEPAEWAAHDRAQVTDHDLEPLGEVDENFYHAKPWDEDLSSRAKSA
jgi:hypothetical protein